MTLMKFLKEGKSSEALSPVASVHKLLGSLSTTIPNQDLPVSVEVSTWETLSDPERLIKTFAFPKFGHMDYFLNELLQYQEDNHHHAKILIDHRDITIETYTRDINLVTSQDTNLAKFCDELYSDIKYFDFSKES